LCTWRMDANDAGPNSWNETRRALSRGARKLLLTTEPLLGALLFQDKFCLFAGQLFFTVGTSDIAKRDRLRYWPKLPKWLLTLLVAITVGRAAGNGSLRSQRMRFRVERMVGENGGHGLARNTPCGLSKY
jgi:hypothetical protein